MVTEFEVQYGNGYITIVFFPKVSSDLAVSIMKGDGGLFKFCNTSLGITKILLMQQGVAKIYQTFIISRALPPR